MPEGITTDVVGSIRPRRGEKGVVVTIVFLPETDLVKGVDNPRNLFLGDLCS